MNEHRFEPYFESDGCCWCGRHGTHRLHRSTRSYLDTNEGQLFARGQTTRSPEDWKRWRAAVRSSNLRSLLPARRT